MDTTRILELFCIFAVMKEKVLILAIIVFVLLSCHKKTEYKIVICIPVYGQSLALGEEAKRITNFDSLANYADGRIVTQDLDHRFGYFENDELKEFAKKLVGYQKRAFELSVYTMAKILADSIGKDTLICIFPGGQGATAIANLSKGTKPYQKFIKDIKSAYEEATKNGWEFIMPAICWMQGESDIADYPNTNYHNMLTQIWKDLNEDILTITQQKDSIPFICYQTNSLTRAEKFKADNYYCCETEVPQTFVDLLRDNSHFWASGPTYPYACVNEKIHIDALGQQSIGALAAKSILGILHGGKRFIGLIPLNITTNNQDVIVKFDVPFPPLVLDTIQVRKVDHYGFSVINKKNKNIAQAILIGGDSVIIHCTESPYNCKIRYAVNGKYMKSGNQNGPRGNLRDFIGNWCYQFDTPATTENNTFFRQKDIK